jgi:1-deoxy-D-xylulose-5-phosphate synthase
MPASAELIPIGTGETLRQGERVALVGYGFGVKVALDAAAELATAGISATVADARFAKPLDTELLNHLAADHELLVTIEDNVLPGGFGAGVLEHLEDTVGPGAGRARVLRVGLPDHYVTHGKPALLHEEVGLTGTAVAERVTAALGSRAVSS